jgi:hypothetical protein
MSKKILILDAVLVALLAWGVVRFRSEWKAFGPAHDLALIQPQPQSFPPLAAAVVPGTAAADWTEIPTRNPFSFDRNDIDIVVVPPPEEPPKPLGPKPVFFGAIILDKNTKWALVAPGPAGKNYKEMKIGAVIDGWTILEIDKKSMAIESQGKRETVVMNDPSVNIPREVIRTASGGGTPSVVQTGQPMPAASAASSNSSAQNPTASVPPPAATPQQGEEFNALDLFGGKNRKR